MASEPRPLLRFYRADDLAMRGALLRGGVSISLGATLAMLTALSHRFVSSEQVRTAMGLLGSASILFGLVTGFVMIPRLLFKETYVGIRRDALVVVTDNQESELAWDDLERIAADGDTVVVRTRAGGEAALTRRYAGKTANELANLLDDARRKASLGLLVE